MRKKRKKPIAKPQFNPPNFVIIILAVIIGFALYSAVDKIFYSENKIILEENRDIRTLLSVSTYEKKFGEKISIQLLNGCGKRGLAENYSVFLIEEGHDVISKSNAPHHEYIKSEIIIRNANHIAAKNISELMGISEQNISVDPNPNLQCDLTIILGKDYKKLTSHSKMLNTNPLFELSK